MHVNAFVCLATSTSITVIMRFSFDGKSHQKKITFPMLVMLPYWWSHLLDEASLCNFEFFNLCPYKFRLGDCLHLKSLMSKVAQVINYGMCNTCHGTRFNQCWNYKPHQTCEHAECMHTQNESRNLRSAGLISRNKRCRFAETGDSSGLVNCNFGRNVW